MGHSYGLVFHPLVLKGLLYFLVVANRALILAAGRLYVVLVFVFVFLRFLLAMQLFNRLFPQSFFARLAGTDGPSCSRSCRGFSFLPWAVTK